MTANHDLKGATGSHQDPVMLSWKSHVGMEKIFRIKFVDKITTNISCSVTFFSENRAVCKIKWGNMAEPEKPLMTI